jgi:hypothetical protein
MPAKLWHLESGAARLELARFSTAVHPLEPDAGLVDACVDRVKLQNFRPLCVELPGVQPQDASRCVERHARGGDFVVAYTDRPAPAMRAEIYWRAQSHELDGAIAAIEVLASVQTSLLDSCPRLSTRSEVMARDVHRLSDVGRGAFAPARPASEGPAARDQPQCYLFRLAASQYSYAEMVHPADAQDSTSQRLFARDSVEPRPPAQLFELKHQLFAERLEKGVILRARILGVLLDRSGDEAAAARHYAAFVSEKLPLTT